MGRKKMGAMPSIVGFRPTPGELDKLNGLVEKTGLSVTGVFRALINAADAEPVIVWRPVVRVDKTGHVTEAMK